MQTMQIGNQQPGPFYNNNQSSAQAPATSTTSLPRNASLHSSQALEQVRDQSSLPDDHVLVGSSIKSSLVDTRAESSKNDDTNWPNNANKAEEKISWLEQDSESRVRKAQWQKNQFRNSLDAGNTEQMEDFWPSARVLNTSNRNQEQSTD